MQELFFEYVRNLYRVVPTYVYEGLASVTSLGVVLILSCYGIKRGLRKSARMVLIEYLFLLYCTTVMYRPYNENQRYDFRPFWSYVAIQEDRKELLPEIVMNILVFVPVGLLLGCVQTPKTWWIAALTCLSISFSIEVLQYLLKRGFAEFDDVFHNTLGCLIGYGMYKLLMFSLRYAK